MPLCYTRMNSLDRAACCSVILIERTVAYESEARILEHNNVPWPKSKDLLALQSSASGAVVSDDNVPAPVAAAASATTIEQSTAAL